MPGLASRAEVHAALSGPARLHITGTLLAGGASPSELAAILAMPSSLLARHLRGAPAGRDHHPPLRRPLLPRLPAADPWHAGHAVRPRARQAQRVLFVCTANSARSHLAAALWRQYRARGIGRSPPASAIAAGTIAAAGRHHLPLRRLRPRHID